MNRRRKITFSVATCLVLFALAETTARLLPGGAHPVSSENRLQFAANPELKDGSERYWQKDPLLFWRMRPHLDVDLGGMHVRTNAGGFRDAEFATVSHGTERRIAFVGDSTTFGWGVTEPQERFSDQVARLLNAAPAPGSATSARRPVRSLNFGQTGYSTVQAGRLLSREVLPLSPDVVVILLAANDFGLASGRTDADQPVVDATASVVARLLAHSTFYRRLARRLATWRDAAGSSPASSGELRRVPPATFRRNLGAMIDRVRAAGARPLLMTYPRRPTNPLLPCPPVDWHDRDAVARRHDALRDLGAILQPAVDAVLASAAPGNASAAPPALDTWERLTSRLAGHPSTLYGRGYLLFRAHRTEAAEKALSLATTASPGGADACAVDLFSTALFRYREEPVAAEYNDIIRDVASRTGTALIDVRRLLARAQRSLLEPAVMPDRSRTALLTAWFVSRSYFVDVVHPSARGHELIAKALVMALSGDGPPASATR
ncbi:MAG: SGNH/GDSL hydrolase family protein [Acidobacteriota bacterium]